MDYDNAVGEGPAKKQKRNTNYCCVPQCSQYSEPGVSLHLFPKDANLKNKWEVALRMGKPASKAMRVCSKHFLVSDYFPGNVSRHKLFPHAVPSKNLPQRQHDRVETSCKMNQRLARQARARQRKGRSLSETQSTSTEDEVPAAQPVAHEVEGVNSATISPLDVAVQVNLADFRQIRPSEAHCLADVLAKQKISEKCTQVNFVPLWTGKVPCSISKTTTLPDLLTNNQQLFTFTGIHSIDLLETLVSCVEDLAIDGATNKKVLSVRDRVLLTMVKIKQNMTFSAIGVLFGINRQTCSNYFKNMCPVIARVLKVVIPWPDQELIRSNLPRSFKNYKCTRIVLDCAETQIEKCKCLKCRILTYSHYKKNHTAKFNVGVTPSGLITEISVPYGGRASDKRIVDDSQILDRMDFMDGVMVDKGFRIEKECEERCLTLIRPPFLKKQQQMTRADALKNADIARARVHVERVIQRLRQYEFLCGPIPWPLAPYFEDILIIAAGLTNLGPPVMNIDKFM